MEFELRSYGMMLLLSASRTQIRGSRFGIAGGFHDRNALMQPHQMGFNKFTVEARILLFACVFSS